MRKVINVNSEFANLRKLHAEIANHEHAIRELQNKITDLQPRLREKIDCLLSDGHNFEDSFMNKLFPFFGIDFDKMLRVKVFNDELKKRAGQKLTLCFPSRETGVNGPVTVWQFYFGILSGEGLTIINDPTPAFAGLFPFTAYTEWRPGFNLRPNRKFEEPFRIAEIRALLEAVADQTLNTTNEKPMLAWHEDCAKETFQRFGRHPMGQTESGWQGFPDALKLLGVE